MKKYSLIFLYLTASVFTTLRAAVRYLPPDREEVHKSNLFLSDRDVIAFSLSIDRYGSGLVHVSRQFLKLRAELLPAVLLLLAVINGTASIPIER